MSDSESIASNQDEPLSELENKLAQVMSGETSQEEFLRAFVAADLYILVDGEPQGGVLGDRKPMVIAVAPDAPRLFAVFSSPTRAAQMIAYFPDYSFPILVNCGWVLEHLGPHMGIAFNPGCANGFELAPEGAQQLKSALAEARSASGE